MIVTQLEEANGKKYRVYLQGERAFLLYKGEVRRYEIREGAELSEDVYEEIVQDVLCKRARRRVLYLLQSMDRTEKQIETKLKQNEYPTCVIEDAIRYVKKFGYIDDERYAQMYIESHLKSKSLRQMEYVLQRKGIDRSVIKGAMECYEDKIDESEQVQHWLRKKKVDLENISKEESYKLYCFLLRKGFSYEIIEKNLSIYRHNV